MELKDRLNQVVSNNLIENINLFIFRDDGIQIYSNDSTNSKAYGPLMAGIWQASTELYSKNFKKDSSILSYSFGNSGTGIYFTSIDVFNRSYLIGTNFRNEKIPGKIKNNINNVSYLIEKILKEHFETKKIESNYLFQNITDAEINKMFGNIGV